jgi:hypothetical protein
MSPYFGEVEEVRYSTVTGWATDASRPDEPVQVALSVNGDRVAEALTNGEHRFELIAPVHVMSSTTVKVLVYDPDGNEVDSLVWGESARRMPSEWKKGSRFASPSFFVVGAAKSGTTSLHVYLDQHPDIFMSKPKEPFFFEAEYDRGFDFYYRRYFGGWKGQREVGESRHRNLYFPFVPARIHAYNPEARILAVLRNPVERAISHWWHWYARGRKICLCSMPFKQIFSESARENVFQRRRRLAITERTSAMRGRVITGRISIPATISSNSKDMEPSSAAHECT